MHTGSGEEDLATVKPPNYDVHPRDLPATSLLLLTTYRDIILGLACYYA
jgi:hypothetical protein